MLWCPCIKCLCWSYVYFFAFATFNHVDYVFWVEVFIYFEFGFRVFKGIGFTFCNYITYFASFLLHLVTPCVVFSPNVEELSILLRFLGCLWILMIFLCLVFLWFCSCFQFLPDFSLFLWIVLDYFCCRFWYMLGVFHCFFFGGVP